MKKLYLLFPLFLYNIYFSQTPCNLPGKVSYLDINNVSAAVTNSGQLWNNLSANGGVSYYISTIDSYLFYFGNIALGGLDVNDSLHLTAQSFTNDRFYPGPLKLNGAQADYKSCNYYDRVWKINRWEVEEFIQKYQDPNYTIPEAILTWPAHGSTGLGYSYNLAPFHDNNGDGHYNPYDGDYPEFDLDNSMGCVDKVYGDQCIYRIFNDVGVNQNTGNAVGVEIHAQAYAYLGGESINNTTFYRYKIINRSNNDYHDFYFANHIDVDLGCYQDDYVGCEVPRGLGYGYNMDTIDDGCAKPIGPFPPAVGIDYVRGPLADVNDSIDNDKDGQIDEPGERISMSFFNSFVGSGQLPASIFGDPTIDEQWYSYFTNIWRNGIPITYGSIGYDTIGIPTKFMFPWYSDTTNWYGTGGINAGGPWSEVTENNPASDRRMLLGVGPFTFLAGETKEITFSTIMARETDTVENQYPSVEKLFLVDDSIQQFADKCYLIDCPTLPENFVYSNTGNVYHFGTEVAATSYLWSFGDGSYATDRFPSHTYSQQGVYTICLQITNNCSSIYHCKDVYIEHKTGVNFAYDITRIEGEGNAGRDLELTDSSIIKLFESDSNFIFQQTYKGKQAPILIENIDNTSIIPGDYIVQFVNIDLDNSWKMYRIGSTDTVYSDVANSSNRQEISQWGIAVTTQLYEYDTILTYNAITTPILSEIIYTGNSSDWLGGLSDTDFANDENWIASGITSTYCNVALTTIDPCIYNDLIAWDDDEKFEHIINGTFAPFRLIRSTLNTLPVYADGYQSAQSAGQSYNDLSFVHSVDIVFTNDTSKWTRCPVLEMQPDSSLSVGNARQFRMRNSYSVNKLGNPDGTGTGMGWFPGYAINVETGHRLNMAFGEDSYLVADNGNDMLFNPTSRKYDSNNEVVFGGKHYLYVFENKERDNYYYGYSKMPLYDNGAFLATNFIGNIGDLQKNWRACSWVGIPMLNPGETFLSSDARVRIRVKKPLRKDGSQPYNSSNEKNPKYLANISILPTPTTSLTANIYPNPSASNLTVQFTNDLNMGIYLKITTLSGAVVKTDFTTEDSFNFNVSSFSGGMYLYYIFNADGTLASAGKFVKQ